MAMGPRWVGGQKERATEDAEDREDGVKRVGDIWSRGVLKRGYWGSSHLNHGWLRAK